MNPQNNIGKICISIEKFYNPKINGMDVKKRPVLIIGCEENYKSPYHVDYELLPVSTMKNLQPDGDFDILIDGDNQVALGLNEPSYIRTNKTTWTHAKQMRLNGISNLKKQIPTLFNDLLAKNHEWVEKRNVCHAANFEYFDEAASDQEGE